MIAGYAVSAVDGTMRFHSGGQSAMPGRGTPIGMRPQPGELRKQFAVYILANCPRGVLYIGMSSALLERIRQHKEDEIPGFTRKYHVKRLVYFEYLDCAEQAIKREKQLKSWRRAWKIDLIERTNPTWRDLWPDIATP